MSKYKGSMRPYNPSRGNINYETYWFYFNQLKEYAINMFEWINLPETIDERYLELQLFEQGYLCFFKDDITADDRPNDRAVTLMADGENPSEIYLALQCTLGGRFNVYNLPTDYHIKTATGYTAHRTMKDSVIIYNNYLHQPTFIAVQQFAYRLYNIERTIDINLQDLKHPYIAVTTESQLLTLKNLLKQVSENEPVLFADKNFDMESLKAVNLGIPNNTIELNALKHQYTNEVLTFFGINNANTDKKERLISNEVDANNEQLLCSRDIMLNSRKMACEQINKMFGLNIDVRFRQEDAEKQEKATNSNQNETNSNQNETSE